MKIHFICSHIATDREVKALNNSLKTILKKKKTKHLLRLTKELQGTFDLKLSAVHFTSYGEGSISQMSPFTPSVLLQRTPRPTTKVQRRSNRNIGP